MQKSPLLKQVTYDESLVLLDKDRDKQQHIEHYNARTLEEAISLLMRYAGGAQVIAGGVDLVHLMKTAVSSPKVLVNIKKVAGLTTIKKDSEGLIIGALTSIHDIEMSPVIGEEYPLLAEAAHSIASPHLRNMATLGGNLCQQVRCWYYRRSPVTGRAFFCRRKGGKKCYAVGGNNTYHAVIGGGECYAVCPSDMAPALMALSARLKIVGPGGCRLLPLDEFYTDLGNVLHSDEIITEVQVPFPRPGTRQSFRKFRVRKAIDFAISSVAAAICAENGQVNDASIILGGIAPVPYRAINAEAFLKGRVITESVAEVAARTVVDEAVPLSMNAYKLPITEALVRRAILD